MWYAIFAFLVLMVLLGIRWCLLPHGRLPRFRVRYLRVRLLLRLHPGRGHASVAELWLRWGRLAMLRRSRRARWSLPAWQRLCLPDEHSLLLGRAHYGHSLRVPVDEHVIVMARRARARPGCWPSWCCAIPARWSARPRRRTCSR